MDIEDGLVPERAVTANETLNDAFMEAIKAAGGTKAVGLALWPAKGVEAARDRLLACLNPDRQEKLSPDEALLIERMARERGCHALMQYRAAVLSYSMPIPVEPKDEADELQRKILAMGEGLTGMLARLEKLRAREA